jgi:predicted enzyme related to lactoylglutathione lyase
MRPLRFSINVTLDGCYDHIVGVVDKDYGRFAWVYDPEGNKVELWDPK